MLSGKADSRALRGHVLVDAALHTLRLVDANNVALPLEDDSYKPEEEPPEKGFMMIQVAGNTVVTDLTEAKLL